MSLRPEFAQDIMQAVSDGEREFDWKLGSLRLNKMEAEGVLEQPVGSKRFSPTKYILSTSALLVTAAGIALLPDVNAQSFISNFLHVFFNNAGSNIVQHFASPGGFYIPR